MEDKEELVKDAIDIEYEKKKEELEARLKREQKRNELLDLKRKIMKEKKKNSIWNNLLKNLGGGGF